MNGFKKRFYYLSNLIYMSLLVMLSACVATSDSSKLNDLTGVVPITTPIPTSTAYSPPETARVKIVTLTGTTAVGNTALTVGDTYQLRAVMVDSTGSVLGEVDATWSVTGTLGIANLTKTLGDPGPRVNYSAGSVATGTIQAIIDSGSLAQYTSRYNVAQTSASTGTITVSLALTPDQILKVSGDTQTGQVGTNLATQLKVRVVNPASTVVPGTNVTFSVLTGGGTIISAQPVVTDANGEALCTVKLGGQTGAGQQSFAATIGSGSVTQVSFSATGTFGPAAKLAFTQHPGGANTTSSFSTQPIVQVQDSYGNLVTNATNSVTLARLAGTGAVTGTSVLSAVSGIATFTNLGYDTAENSVTLQATAAGLTSATSSAFDVGAIIANAQCAANGAGWNTTDGGCKDLTSGLVYSAMSAGTYSWHSTAWDSTVSGSDVPEAWEVAKGLTKDVDTGAITGDQNAASYCHSLVESGLSDWRMPTYNELLQAITDGSGAALKSPTVAFWSSTNYHVSNSYYFTAQAYQGGGSITDTTSYHARCVRRPAPTKILITTQPAAATKGFGINVPFQTPMVVKVTDSTNSVDPTATNSITISHNGTGQLCRFNAATGVVYSCGATVTLSAASGVLTLSDLVYSTTGSIQLTASAAGLTSATSNTITVNQTYPWAGCVSVGGVWINGIGGCKDTLTGAIYSSMSTSTINWNDAVWDQTNPAGNAGTADTDDTYGHANDYDQTRLPTTNFDGSSVNYCHSLKESGQTDWVLPAYEQSYYKLGSDGKAPQTYLNLPASTYMWTSSTYSTDANAYIDGSFIGGYHSNSVKSGLYPVHCVRRDAPAALQFKTQPAYAASCSDYNGGTINNDLANDYPCAGAGVQFNNQPVVKIVDADGAGPLVWDTTSVTLTVVPASDATGGTGRLLQYGTVANAQDNKVMYAKNSITVVAVDGQATFARLAYDKPGEKFRLRATATATYKGQVIVLTTAYSNDLQTAGTAIQARCRIAGAFSTAHGGCEDPAGLVWTYGGSATWSDAIWDSANGGDSRKVLTSDGVTLEPTSNEYDNTHGVGTGTDLSARDVCHRLHLNGFYDWRMPTFAELQTGLSPSAHNGILLLRYGAGSYIWSSATGSVSSTSSYMAYPIGYGGSTGYWLGAPNEYPKTTYSNMIYCVRNPNATSLYIYPNSP